MKTPNIFLLLISFFFAACNKDGNCPQWHEGADCARMTHKYAGAWYGSDDASGASVSISVAESTPENRISITKGNATFYADLYDSGESFNIPSQSIPFGSIEGLGYMRSGSILYVQYTITEQNGSRSFWSITVHKP